MTQEVISICCNNSIIIERFKEVRESYGICTGLSAVDAYVFTVAHNVLCNFYWRKRREGERTSDEPEEPLPDRPQDPLEESSLERNLREEALCVEGLTVKLQIVYIYYRISDASRLAWHGRILTTDESAEVEKIKDVTRRSRLSRARYAVLKCLHAKGVIDTETYNRLMEYDPL